MVLRHLAGIDDRRRHPVRRASRRRLPRLNANLRSPPNGPLSFTGDVDSWVFDPDPAVNALNAGQFGFRSQHPSGANFLFGDGSVKFLKETINPDTYRGISTRQVGEAISADAY